MRKSAAQIHDWHLNQGWAGIGYHFVIRKDGTLEIGRPEHTVGSHAYGFNDCSIGIHLSGDFQSAQPTGAQIATAAELVRDLCNDYNLPRDRAHVVGHCDLMATDCPGKNLYVRLDEIINGKRRRIESVFDLARKYESSGDCGSVGHGYGLYQFTPSTVKQFVDWLKNYHDDALANYGRTLADAQNFDGTWQMLATVDPGHFSALQDEFAFDNYFVAACKLFAKENFTVEAHGLNLHAVIFARAIQHGIFGCVELFKRACRYPNLSYADAPTFDRELIADVYDYLIDNPSFGLSRHDLDDALRNRFIAEKQDALA